MPEPKTRPPPSGLNPGQQLAAEHPPGPLLIIAGPGSGKTRVLTHRVANLIRMHRVPSHQVLAVTFTNAAAGELKRRAIAMTPTGGRDITISTFHAFCNRQLRSIGPEYGHRSDFTIADHQDQRQLVKDVLTYHQVEPRQTTVRDMHSSISKLKSRLITPAQYTDLVNTDDDADFIADTVSRIYPTYERFLANANLLDFDDLLVHLVRLMQQHPAARQRLSNRYRHILVDEFQDTDPAQYELCRLLAGNHLSISVVGDPDQSIYGWRNADISNILNFPQHYPGTTVITLDHNYRSTPQIVSAAHDVISNNTERIEHPLLPTRNTGAPVRYAQARDPREEAQLALELLEQAIREDAADWSAAAVLFRANRHSRPLEEACVFRSVPYRLMGGTPFYQRREIKDVLGYLRLLHNPADTVSFQRSINLPPRRIGSRTVETLMSHAMDTSQTPIQVIQSTQSALQQTLGLKAPPLRAIGVFLRLYERFTQLIKHATVRQLANSVLEDTGLDKHIQSLEEGADRWQNVLELLDLCEQFGAAAGPSGLTSLLDHVTLVDQTDTDQGGEPPLTLATLHKAKGTEFSNVVMIGMNEGGIPNAMSNDPQEERRLCYVGLTRAQDRLFLLRALNTFNGPAEPSRYLFEINDLEYPQEQ